MDRTPVGVSGEFNSHREKEMQSGICNVCLGLFDKFFDIVRLHSKFSKQFPAEPTESSMRIYHLPVPE